MLEEEKLIRNGTCSTVEVGAFCRPRPGEKPGSAASLLRAAAVSQASRPPSASPLCPRAGRIKTCLWDQGHCMRLPKAGGEVRT